MKYALVTGGSGEIGAAICHTLAKQGCFVYVHGHSNPQKAEAVAAEICSGGGHAKAVTFDLTDSAATTAALDNLLKTAPIQIVINNAGIHNDAPFAGMSAQQWQDVTRVSIDGFFNVTQPLLMPMMRTRWGRIISVSSISGIMGNRGQTNYAAAKAALHAASKSLSRECASRGITVNVVAPGIIESASTSAYDADTVKQMVPMKRKGTPQEVANVIGFLASDAASYVSGQILAVDGGIT